jgi:protein gp37
VKTSSREYKKAIWQELPKWNERARKSGKREKVFVMSMGDFFEDHPQVEEWRRDAIDQMEAATMLDFQVLTKRPENVEAMVPKMWRSWHWPAHVWIGTSVENQEQADKRIPELLRIPAAVRFLSVEPLLGPVELKKWLGNNFHWVIVGGESGPNARPMHPDWARAIRDECVEAGVPFFMKQMNKIDPIPADLLIREFPAVASVTSAEQPALF